ncbi:MAG: mucoidy inhibitor MuiA family protein [Myxococcota bacterium]
MRGVDSDVTAVHLYARGAQVSRTATLVAQAETVAFEGLPLCLEDDSVRVSVHGDASVGWSVQDVGVEVETPAPDAALAPADDEQLQMCTQARDRLARRLALLDASIEGLRGVELRPRMSAHKDERPQTIPTAARVRWLSVQARHLDALRTQRAELVTSLHAAEEALDEVMAARAAGTTARNARQHEPRKRVVLRLVAGASAESVTLRLHYRVPGTRWSPSYVLRLDTEGQARLELRAVVAQHTGEDWTRAALTVSTASLQRWHELPELEALRVGRVQPAPRRAGWRSPPPDPEALYADFDRARDAMASPLDALAGAAPPPPLPRPAPAPMAAAMPQGLGGAPASARAAAPRRAKKRAAAVEERAAMASFGAPAEAMDREELDLLEDADAFEGAAPGVGLGRDWFDYARLRLQSPSGHARGRLHRGEAEPSRAVHDAIGRALSVGAEALPPGHAWISSRSGYDYAYATEGTVSIPSDGQGHVVTVLEVPLQPTRRYVCVPGGSDDVFRTLVLRNPSEQPWPAGPLDVYERGSFVLTSSLDDTAAGGRCELGLGVEQAIKVARNVTFTEDSEGLIKRHNAYAHRVRIDVRNLLPHAASIELRERVPVAARDDDDIEVSEADVAPPWDAWEPPGDPLQGGRRWRVEVPAGEQSSLEATWTVRVPGGSELVGGNRRDR